MSITGRKPLPVPLRGTETIREVGVKRRSATRVPAGLAATITAEKREAIRRADNRASEAAEADSEVAAEEAVAGAAGDTDNPRIADRVQRNKKIGEKRNGADKSG